MTGWRILTVAVVSLALSACGGAAKKERAATKTTQTTQTTSSVKDTSPAGVQKCLAAAGYEVVARGDLPIIQRSKAVGVRLPDGGNIRPGKLSAAVFWYGSGAKAERMQTSVQFNFKAILRVDEIVAVFDPAPSAETQTKFLNCITP